nr:hypothetical protein [Tanacetum cinerariifolium]
ERGWKIHHLDVKADFLNVNVDDLFMTGTSLDLINEFKKRMASQFEMSDLGEITYYLGIEVSKRKELRGDQAREICNEDLKRSYITGHVFYLGTSPITWCSQKQTTLALSLCKAEFMAATTVACQAIRPRELLTEVTGLKRQKVIVEHESGENQRADPLTKALACIIFKEMRSLLGVQDLPSSTQKFRG